eukprot:g1944.t1
MECVVPCDDFQLDLTSNLFGICKRCGLKRNKHHEDAKNKSRKPKRFLSKYNPGETMIDARSSEREKFQRHHSARRGSKPAPPSTLKPPKVTKRFVDKRRTSVPRANIVAARAVVPPTKPRKSTKPSKRKISPRRIERIPSTDSSGSLPDLSGIGDAGNLSVSVNCSADGVTISSEEEDSNDGDDDTSRPPMLPPRKPSKTSKPSATEGGRIERGSTHSSNDVQQTSASVALDISGEVLDDFFSDVIGTSTSDMDNILSPLFADDPSTEPASHVAPSMTMTSSAKTKLTHASDILEVLAAEGRASQRRAFVGRDPAMVDMPSDDDNDGERPVSLEKGDDDVTKAGEAGTNWLDSMFDPSSALNDDVPPVVRRGSRAPPKPSSRRRSSMMEQVTLPGAPVRPPPGVDPAIFASLPVDVQREQRELYEREEERRRKNREIEERDRAIAKKMSDMDLLDTPRDATSVAAPTSSTKESTPIPRSSSGLRAPKGVDPHVFSGLPLDIQREVIAAHRRDGAPTVRSPAQGDTSPSPTMSNRRVQCPYCKAIIPLKKDANYVSCPDCRQTVAAPKSSSTAQRRVVCGHCSAAMRIPADAKEAVCPRCWKMVNLTLSGADSHGNVASPSPPRTDDDPAVTSTATPTRTDFSARSYAVPIRSRDSGATRRRSQLMCPLNKAHSGLVECALWRINGGKEFRMYLIENRDSDGAGGGDAAGAVDHQLLLSGKSDMFVRGLNLAISMSPDARKDSPGYIGKLRGDVSQLRYVVYDDGLSPKDAPKSITAKERARHLRQQLADVSYTIVPGPKKTTTRAMTVLIPKSSADGRTWKHWTPMDDADTMKSAYDRGEWRGLSVLSRDEDDSGVLWAFKPSTKNFTLVDNEQRKRVLAFGKVAKDQFRVMLRHPLSYFQAFAICVSAINARAK